MKKQLKEIKSLEIIGESTKFIHIKFDTNDKTKVCEIVGRLPLSIHTQDNITTATIKIY